MLARITHRMREALDAIALHEPHRAGIERRPDSFRAVALGRQRQPFGDLVERVVPGDRHESLAAAPLFTDAADRGGEAVRMVLALGITGDLGANDSLRIGLALGAAHPADRRPIEALHRQRTGARAIMRTDAVGGVERQQLLQMPSLPQNISRRAPDRYGAPAGRRR